MGTKLSRRWLRAMGIAGLALALFVASLAPSAAALSIRGYAGENSVTSGRAIRSTSTGQDQGAPAPVIGEPATETPDPNYPVDVNAPEPVIGEPVSEEPDPNEPEDVNAPAIRTIRR